MLTIAPLHCLMCLRIYLFIFVTYTHTYMKLGHCEAHGVFLRSWYIAANHERFALGSTCYAVSFSRDDDLNVTAVSYVSG